MNKNGKNSLLASITSIFVILGFYCSVFYFLFNTDMINKDTITFNIRLIYMFLSILAGLIIIVFVMISNKDKLEEKKKK